MKRNTFLKSLLALPFIGAISSFTKKPKEEVTVFTEEMLRKNNYGLFIIKSTVKDVRERPGYAATVAWKLGYCYHTFKYPIFDNKGKEYDEKKFTFQKYGKMNFLTDGWYYPIGDNYKDILEYLNNNPNGDKFRLMTKDEVIFLLTERKQGFYE
jgi:hypothetical protein